MRNNTRLDARGPKIVIRIFEKLLTYINYYDLPVELLIWYVFWAGWANWSSAHGIYNIRLFVGFHVINIRQCPHAGYWKSIGYVAIYILLNWCYTPSNPAKALLVSSNLWEYTEAIKKFDTMFPVASDVVHTVAHYSASHFLPHLLIHVQYTDKKTLIFLTFSVL